MNEARSRGPVSEVELFDFASRYSALINAEGHEDYPNCPVNWRVLEVSTGPKKAKLLHVTEAGLQDGREIGRTHVSVCLFIDMSNGDILKAEGMNKAAKHARGNIRIGTWENWWNNAVTSFGAAYLR